MNTHWYERLASRERLLLLLTLMAILLAGWYQWVWIPFAQALQAVESRLSDTGRRLENLPAGQPEAPWRVQAGQWVPSGEGAALLAHLTHPGPGVRLSGLELRPSRLLFSCGHAPDRPGPDTLFRHDLLLTLEGGYPSLLGTLHRLEKRPWTLYLDHLDYQSGPAHATLLVHLHFLSTGPTLSPE